MTNLEKVTLLGGYDQLVKGYKITRKTFVIRFCDWGTHTNKNLVWPIERRRVAVTVGLFPEAAHSKRKKKQLRMHGAVQSIYLHVRPKLATSL